MRNNYISKNIKQRREGDIQPHSLVISSIGQLNSNIGMPGVFFSTCPHLIRANGSEHPQLNPSHDIPFVTLILARHPENPLAFLVKHFSHRVRILLKVIGERQVKGCAWNVVEDRGYLPFSSLPIDNITSIGRQDPFVRAMIPWMVAFKYVANAGCNSHLNGGIGLLSSPPTIQKRITFPSDVRFVDEKYAPATNCGRRCVVQLWLKVCGKRSWQTSLKTFPSCSQSPRACASSR